MVGDFCVQLALGATEVLQTYFCWTDGSLLWFCKDWLGWLGFTWGGGVLKFLHIHVTWPLHLILVGFLPFALKACDGSYDLIFG